MQTACDVDITGNLLNEPLDSGTLFNVTGCPLMGDSFRKNGWYGQVR